MKYVPKKGINNAYKISVSRPDKVVGDEDGDI